MAMHPADRRRRRLVHFVSALKRGELPTTRSLARRFQALPGLGHVCRRTLQRDLDYLRLELDAPIDYDQARHGYVLTDPEWVLPLEALHGPLLYASVFGATLSLPVVPPPLRLPLEQVLKAQLTAADPEDVDPDLLRAIVFATGARADLSAEVFDVVHQAWRETRRLRLLYGGGGEPGTTPREVDVHALFLAQGAWYARVYCHRRHGIRSLAIHRMRDPEILAQRFRRDPEVVQQLRQGNVFDYEAVRNVVVGCSPEKARVIREREWFPGQVLEVLPDGSLRLRFPVAPRPELVYWVMSYCGHLVVREPPDLVAEIRHAGERIALSHGS
jgi:predicted DNA-binding transcriptional regulator YafY